MYRQVTLPALLTGGLAALNTAYDSLLFDWRYYLQHLNDGRPFVLVGHSQGAAMLIRLIAEQIEPNPSVRKRLVTAILAGGNLQVPTGQTVGGTFHHIPLCTSTSRPGCVIAYSTFGTQPPADALFGRPGTGVSLMSLQLTTAGQQVACVNAASIAGGTAALSPYFPQAGSVPWVSYPQLYTASCESANGATWLQVNTIKAPGDARPVVTASLGPTWGYHIDDINLVLGNLVSDVSDLEAALRQ
jgi:pimeloyl-ACP methyl ester carboxylesterase